jgi:cytoskeletal protein RodZ
VVDDGLLPASSDNNSPGAMLKAAREELEITEREAADRLNWMPNYVAIIERDEYTALRSPSFAKGYVKAFGRLVELDEEVLMAAFAATETPVNVGLVAAERSTPTELPPHKTGLSIVVGLCSLSLLFAILWWWQGNFS